MPKEADKVLPVVPLQLIFSYDFPCRVPCCVSVELAKTRFCLFMSEPLSPILNPDFQKLAMKGSNDLDLILKIYPYEATEQQCIGTLTTRKVKMPAHRRSFIQTFIQSHKSRAVFLGPCRTSSSGILRCTAILKKTLKRKVLVVSKLLRHK